MNRGFVREFWPYLLLAGLLHAALVVFLIVNLDRGVLAVDDIDDPPEAIEATVVDEALVERELERVRETERRREQEVEDARLAAEAAARQREQEERRIRELQAQREREERQAVADRERREREARERAERERQAELERQRRAEEERLAEIERQRQAEADRQRREQEARERAEREAREARERAERERRQQAVLNQWARDIQSRVQRSWIRPDNWPAGTSCTVRVSMIPGGEVVQARLLDSCGSDQRDRSVESAVLRASPMPMPEDPAVFRREIDLVFRPVN